MGSTGKISFGIGAAAVALLLAGCGGSGTGTTGGATTSATHHVTVHTAALTKAQFVDRADAICAAGRRLAKAEFTAYLKSHRELYEASITELVEHAPELVDVVLVPAYQREIDRIEALGAPKGEERAVRSILVAMQRSLDEGSKQPRRFLGVNRPFIGAAGLARAYGLVSCVETRV